MRSKAHGGLRGGGGQPDDENALNGGIAELVGSLFQPLQRPRPVCLQLDYSLEKDAPQPNATTIDAMRWCWQPREDRNADLEYSLMGYAVVRTGIQAFLADEEARRRLS